MAQRMVEIPVGGGESLRFDLDVLTIAQTKNLRAGIKKVGDDYNGSIEEKTKVQKELGKALSVSLQRKEEETDKDYGARSQEAIDKFNAAINDLLPKDNEYFLTDLAFECLLVIAKLFGQDYKLNKEAFENVPWGPIKRALADLLLEHGCELGGIFLPPKLSEEP